MAALVAKGRGFARGRGFGNSALFSLELDHLQPPQRKNQSLRTQRIGKIGVIVDLGISTIIHEVQVSDGRGSAFGP